MLNKKITLPLVALGLCGTLLLAGCAKHDEGEKNKADDSSFVFEPGAGSKPTGTVPPEDGTGSDDPADSSGVKTETGGKELVEKTWDNVLEIKSPQPPMTDKTESTVVSGDYDTIHYIDEGGVKPEQINKWANEMEEAGWVKLGMEQTDPERDYRVFDTDDGRYVVEMVYTSMNSSEVELRGTFMLRVSDKSRPQA